MSGDVMSQSAQALMLSDWIATQQTRSGYVGPSVRLYTTDLTYTDATIDSVVFVEPTSGWYAAKIGSYGQIFLRSDGKLEVVMDSEEFDFTSASTVHVCTIYGYYVTNPDGDVIHAQPLETPQEMSNTLQSVVVQPRLVFSPAVVG